jgi:hypothetical protein
VLGYAPQVPIALLGHSANITSVERLAGFGGVVIPGVYVLRTTGDKPVDFMDRCAALGGPRGETNQLLNVTLSSAGPDSFVLAVLTGITSSGLITRADADIHFAIFCP